MKLFKKAAALFFCLALALSVMAVSALADEEAELLAAARINLNPEFTVTLTQKNNDTATDHVGSGTTNNGLEINASDTVTFDINLAYSHTETAPYPDFTGLKLDSFQFDFVPGEQSDASGNKGATFVSAKVVIGSNEYTINHEGTVGTNYTNTYAYYSSGTNTDIVLASSATKIGEITVAFAGAAQDKAIIPEITNILFHVNGGNGTGYQDMRRPAKLKSGSTAQGEISFAPGSWNSSSNTYTDMIVIDGSGAQVTTSPDTSLLEPAAGVSDTPIWVNPTYTVKLQEFEPDGTTGIIALKKASGIAVTSDVKYNFTEGSFKTNSDYKDADGKSTVLTHKEIPGYTLQGWMVTADTDASTTWEAYAWNGIDAWDKETSYPAYTGTSVTHTNNPTTETYWAANAWVTATIDSNGKVETTTTGITKSADGTVIGVNFIPKDTAAGATYTVIPPKMAGDITLTPVYTRDVYTATFNAGDNDAKFAENANNLTPVNALSNPVVTVAYRTKTYTIEDLYGGNTPAIIDFLDLANNTEKENKGLARVGYKFVGWTIGAQNDITDNTTYTETEYQWVKNQNTRVNEVEVIHIDDEQDENNYIHHATCKHYGSLTFTAEWELDICFAKVNYTYAGGSNYSLILVGVPAPDTGSNYDDKYTYTCQVGSGINAQDYDMFIIPKTDNNETIAAINANRRNGYVAAAYAATNANSTNNTNYTFTEEYLRGGTGANATGNYVLYAYIASADTPESYIKLEETNDTRNEPLKYDGDIDGSGIVNVGDFGNVIALIRKEAVEGIFVMTDQTNVKVRLLADMHAKESDTSVFGSIADVKAIYNVMGYQANVNA